MARISRKTSSNNPQKTFTMRIKALFLSLLIPAAFLFAQDQPDGPVTVNSLAGLLRTQLTITPGWSLLIGSGNNSGAISGGRTNVYLHGTAEYYLSPRYSMRGDGFYFINKDKSKGGMRENHAFEVGAGFHLLKSMNFDPFIGLGMGMNMGMKGPMDITDGSRTLVDFNPGSHIDPVWGPRVGMNFYSQKIFHFFIEAHYFMGTYRPAQGPSYSLNELRVSAGLGFNWVFLKKEGTVRKTI